MGEMPDRAAIERAIRFEQFFLQELTPFCLPLVIAPDLSLTPGTLHCGSGCLIESSRQKLIVTCYHVWQAFENCKGSDQSGHLIPMMGEGYGGMVEIVKPALLAWDKELDLAIIKFEDTEGILNDKKYYSVPERGLHRVSVGDVIVVVGFPRIWRLEVPNAGIFGYCPLPFTVSDVTDRGFVVSEWDDNAEVFKGLDREPKPDGLADSTGGLSGAPAFAVSTIPFRLVGLVTKRGLGRLFFTHADLLSDCKFHVA